MTITSRDGELRSAVPIWSGRPRRTGRRRRRPVIAARFHNGVAAAIVTVCARLRDQAGLAAVALSGGVFQNLLLTGRW